MTRGTRKRPASRAASGALASAARGRATGRTSSGAIGGVARGEVRGRRHAGRVDLLHRVGVGEDVAELAREQFHFGGIELEVRERGDRLDLRSRESGGHAKC